MIPRAFFAGLVAASLALPNAAVHRAGSPDLSLSALSTSRGFPAANTLQTAVLAGGCFWGVEAVFEHVKGVTDVVSGYAGGTKATADYETVSSGSTRHAESVLITFDPALVTYEKLLEIFFTVAHDPTQLNRQGPDEGPQYRSAIFYADTVQARRARTVIAERTRVKAHPRPIVTQVVSLEAFYPAEEYHQDFAARNPRHPYIVFHDAPKVEHLRAKYPELYQKSGR